MAGLPFVVVGRLDAAPVMKGILMKMIWSGVLAALLALCGACSDAADGPKVPDSPKTDAADYRIGDKLAPAVAARAASAAVAGGYRLTTWEDLTPKDWDPMKDVQADAIAMQNRLISRRQVIAESGRDIEDVDAEIDADPHHPKPPPQGGAPREQSPKEDAGEPEEGAEDEDQSEAED